MTMLILQNRVGESPANRTVGCPGKSAAFGFDYQTRKFYLVDARQYHEGRRANKPPQAHPQHGQTGSPGAAPGHQSHSFSRFAVKSTPFFRIASRMEVPSKLPSRRLSVAPMMDWTEE
jgi:hypothetical protein